VLFHKELPPLGANAKSIYHRVAQFAEGLLVASLQYSVGLLLHRRGVATKCFMSLRSPTDNESADFVMPAWIAGIQVCRMRPETSMSTWVPALHAGTTKIVGCISEAPSAVFPKEDLRTAKAAI
jgi:hypothetical protein